MKAQKPKRRMTWPKIRLVHVRGEKFYQVDARRKGTDGKRETFRTKKEAEDRASKIAETFKLEGSQYFSLDAKNRELSIEAIAILQPFDVTVLEAAKFYEAHRHKQAAITNSRTINLLADEWASTRSKESTIKPITKWCIKKFARHLKINFGEKRLLELTKRDFQNYFDSLSCSQAYKRNIRQFYSMFYNWCIEKEYTTVNPLTQIKKITLQAPNVVILNVEKAQALMQLCKCKEYNMLLPYHAISLFAGLRPTEAELLKWDNIHLEERQITVLSSTSKTNETRNVPIEDTLYQWLNHFDGDKTGRIVNLEGAKFRNKIESFRAALGYAVLGKNKDGEKWTKDILRHSYASYWLAKYNDRAHLAEHMGNSIQIIKRHYKAVVSKSAMTAFWNIMPTVVNEVISISSAAASAAQAKKLGNVLAEAGA